MFIDSPRKNLISVPKIQFSSHDSLNKRIFAISDSQNWVDITPKKLHVQIGDLNTLLDFWGAIWNNV